MDRFDSRRPSAMGVYVVYGSDGRVEYIGRSKNIANRLRQHGHRFANRRIETLATGTYGATRALEDLLIRHYKGVGEATGNKIHGISRRNIEGRRQYYNALRAVLSTMSL